MLLSQYEFSIMTTKYTEQTLLIIRLPLLIWAQYCSAQVNLHRNNITAFLLWMIPNDDNYNLDFHIFWLLKVALKGYSETHTICTASLCVCDIFSTGSTEHRFPTVGCTQYCIQGHAALQFTGTVAHTYLPCFSKQSHSGQSLLFWGYKWLPLAPFQQPFNSRPTFPNWRPPTTTTTTTALC